MYKFYHNSEQAAASDAVQYDRFDGRLYVVDLATIDGHSEDFPGRDWLEEHIKNRLPLGFDLEWQPDRNKESDNPIALMQFANQDTCLLLRTHRTGNWLPHTVLKALCLDTCTKVIVGWDGPDKQKMQNTFNLEPNGISDLADLAKQKGLSEQGLKSLSQYFGLRMKKDSRMARSNWACDHLTEEQRQYAADDAYFTWILHDKLRSMPDAEKEEEYNGVDRGVLQMKPGWEEQGIVRRHDGLWCKFCSQGPMTVPMVVEKHIGGRRHSKKIEERSGLGSDFCQPAGEVPEQYAQQGIVLGDGINGCKAGEYKCILCNAGPLATWVVVMQHINSNKHQKKVGIPAAADVQSKPEETPKDPFEDVMWNMPDYVESQGSVGLVNTLCGSKLATPQMAFLHLGGTKNQKKAKAAGYPEIMYIKEKERLEVLETGAPVVRTGYKAPKRGSNKPGTKAAEKVAESGDVNAAGDKLRAAAKQVVTGAGAREPDNASVLTGSTRDPDTSREPEKPCADLPPGWERHHDPNSHCDYYYNPSTGVSTWEKPELPRASGLPPGWRKVPIEAAEDGSRQHYFADIQTMTSQWEEPPPYVPRKWERHVDPHNSAYWRCEELDLAFFESDSGWQRLRDDLAQCIFWSSSEKGIRFFEPSLG